MRRLRLSKAEARILEQCWKLGTCSVREILDSLPPAAVRVHVFSASADDTVHGHSQLRFRIQRKR